MGFGVCRKRSTSALHRSFCATASDVHRRGLPFALCAEYVVGVRSQSFSNWSPSNCAPVGGGTPS
eukprot:scaffold434_cov186-Pinguiococcus_pyrenoidosus.AAC.112